MLCPCRCFSSPRRRPLARQWIAVESRIAERRTWKVSLSAAGALTFPAIPAKGVVSATRHHCTCPALPPNSLLPRPQPRRPRRPNIRPVHPPSPSSSPSHARRASRDPAVPPSAPGRRAVTRGPKSFCTTTQSILAPSRDDSPRDSRRRRRADSIALATDPARARAPRCPTQTLADRTRHG